MSEVFIDEMPLDQAFGLARQRLSEGKLAEAERLFGRILGAVPQHPETLTLMGSVAYQRGDNIQGEAYVSRAIEIYRAVLAERPHNVSVRGPLVNLLLSRGQRAEAEALMGDLFLPINPIRSTMPEFMERRQKSLEAGLPPILINTVPKSASESIWNRLAEGLGLPQGHLSLGLFPDVCLVPARLVFAAQGGFISKEHIPATPYNLAQLAKHKLTRVVFHVRDPRQATLSWAHFVRDDVAMRTMAPLWRRIVPDRPVLERDLAGLVDWCIDSYLPILIEFMAAWVRIEADKAQPIRVLFRSFELFLKEPDSYLESVLEFYDIDKARFASEAEAEVVHLRKGESEEWRGVFTKAQQRRAWEKIPRDLAERFGWTA